MRSSAAALATFEVSIRRRRTALTGGELIRVHPQAHRAAWFTPLEAGVAKDGVETLEFSLLLDAMRPRYDKGPHAAVNVVPLGDTGGGAKVLDA